MRQIVALLLLITIFSGCRDKVICPAFQSTYILDDSVRLTYYSYLWKIEKDERLKYLADQRASSPDSAAFIASVGNSTDYFAYVEEFIVPPNEVNKSKFGIVKYEPYWLKNYKLKSAPMENILSPPEEEEQKPVDTGEFVASDFSDTINVAGDTTAVALQSVDEADTTYSYKLPTLARAPKPKPKKETVYLFRYDPKDEMLNVEQQYYNKHFGQQLYRKVEVIPPAPITDESDSTSTKGKGLKGLFDFFRKEKSEPVESETQLQEQPTDEEVTEELTEEEQDPSGN